MRLLVLAHDRSCLLRDLTSVLAAEKSNVLAMSSSSDTKNQTAAIELELELYNLDGLSRVHQKPLISNKPSSSAHTAPAA